MQGNGQAATDLGTFGTFSLYDGANQVMCGAVPCTANYVAGDVVFTGFSSVIPMNSNKVFTLKGSINSSGNMTRNTTTRFVVKSDSNTDMEARSASGSLLGTAEINYNQAVTNGAAESKFATSTAYVFHDAYPTIAATLFGKSLIEETKAKLLKFSVTNSGLRPMKLASTTISVTVFGLVVSGVVSDFRLYEDNGGALGTQLASSTVANVVSTTANPSLVHFNTSTDISHALHSYIIPAIICHC